MAQPSNGLREFLRRNGPRASVALVCLIFVAILWAGLLTQLNLDRDRIIESRRATNENLAKIFEEHVTRTIRAAEVTLREIAEGYRRSGRKFDLAQFAEDRRTYLDPYNILNISDENGDVVTASIPAPQPVNYRNNDNNQYHEHHDTSEIFIGQPRRGTTTGKWTVYLSIRINKAGGAFGGVAVLGMDPSYFSNIYEGLNLGKDALVAVIGRDGVVRIRSSGAVTSAAQNVAGTLLFTRYLRAANHGSFIGTSSVDGVSRLISFRALENYPLVVVVGTSIAALLSGHDERRSLYLKEAGALSALLLGLGLFALLQIARGDRASEALKHSSEKFSKAFHASPDSIALSKRDTGELLEVNEGFERISGYSRDEAIGRTAIQLGMWVHPDQRAKLVGQLASGGALRDIETVFRRKGGGERMIQISLEAIDLEGEKCMLAIGRDVTEHKQAENARAHLAAIVESSNDAIIGRAVDGTITSWNDAAERIFGYTTAEVIGRNLTEILPPELRHEIAEQRKRLLAGQPGLNYETVRIAKNGRRINTATSVSAIKDNSGKIIGIAATHRDITERIEAEKALRESDERLRLAVDSGGVGLWERNIAADQVTWSAQVKTLFGLSEDSEGFALGEFFSAIHPDDRAAVQRAYATALENRTEYDQVFRIVRPNGDVRWVVSKGHGFYDPSGRPVSFLGAMLDITEQKQADETLRKSEFELKEAQRVGHIGSWDWNAETDTGNWTEEVCRIFGCDPSRPRPSYAEHLEFFTPESQSRLKAAVEDALQSGTPYALDLELVNAISTRNWISVRGEAVRDASGQVIGLRGTAQDITELKNKEKALQSYAVRLRELSQRLREVEETERRSISRELHDRIGQGLTTLTLMLGTLHAHLPKESRSAVQPQLNDMQGLLRSVVAQVRDIMGELRPPVLDDYGLLAALRHLVTEFSRRTGIAADLSGVDLNTRLPSILETAMFRICQEAFNNIAKHAHAKKVEISLNSASEQVVLAIKDDGVGFDTSKLPHGGAHWGMATMRERAEAAGITFRLESAPGAGTRIILEAERAAS